MDMNMYLKYLEECESKYIPQSKYKIDGEEIIMNSKEVKIKETVRYLTDQLNEVESILGDWKKFRNDEGIKLARETLDQYEDILREAMQIVAREADFAERFNATQRFDVINDALNTLRKLSAQLFELRFQMELNSAMISGDKSPVYAEMHKLS